MVTIDRELERLISEKQNNKASAEGARLPKEAMLLRDIFNLPSHPWTRFVLLDSSAGLAKGQEFPLIALTLTFIKQTSTKHKTYFWTMFVLTYCLALDYGLNLISLCKADHTSSD